MDIPGIKSAADMAPECDSGGCPLMRTAENALVPPFQRPPSHIAIRRVENYEQDLFNLIYETLLEFQKHAKLTPSPATSTGATGVSRISNLRGKTVLLKPNFVGHDPLGAMNTHPAVIAAAKESFLKLGAAQV